MSSRNGWSTSKDPEVNDYQPTTQNPHDEEETENFDEEILEENTSKHSLNDLDSLLTSDEDFCYEEDGETMIARYNGDIYISSDLDAFDFLGISEGKHHNIRSAVRNAEYGIPDEIS